MARERKLPLPALVSIFWLSALLLFPLSGQAQQPAPSATGPPAGKGTLLPTEPTRQPATTATAVPVELATPLADGSIVHIVQAGQAMWSIAIAYGVPLADLYALNGMDENSVIFPGDRILVRRVQTTLTPSFGTGTPLPELTPSLTPTSTVRPTRTLRPTDLSTTLPTIAPTQASLPTPAQAAGRPDLLLALTVVLFVVGLILVGVGSLLRRRR